MKGHIPQASIEEIRSRSNIVELISEFVALKKAGRNYVGLCPFHNEKTPSFTVNPEKQICYCFGCGEGGNEISFLMKLQDLPFPEAVRRIAARRGVVIPDDRNSAAGSDAARMRELIKVHRMARDFYAGQLRSPRGKGVRDYLSRRGMDAAMTDAFSLGFAPPGWRNLENHLVAKGVPETVLRPSGLVVYRDDGKRYDRFRSRLIFPIENIQGDVIAFGGREFGGGEPKYLNSPESPIYSKGDHLYGLSRTKQEIRDREFAVLVEGYFDLLALWNAGIRNVAATLGTALTRNHLSLLGRFCRRVVLLFDGDEGGAGAAERSLPLFLEVGMSAAVAVLPRGSDPDDYVKEHGGSAVTRIIEEAPSLVDYYIDALMQHHDGIEEKSRLAREAIAFIRKIPDVIQRNLFIKRVAEKLGLDQQVIKNEVNRGTERNTATPAATVRVGGHDPVELYLLYLMTEFPDRLSIVSRERIFEYCSSSALRSMEERIGIIVEEGGTLTLATVINEIADADTADHLLKLAMGDRPDESIVERILYDTMNKIKGRWYRERRRSLNQRLAEARDRGDRLLCDRLLLEKKHPLNEEKAAGAPGPDRTR